MIKNQIHMCESASFYVYMATEQSYRSVTDTLDLCVLNFFDNVEKIKQKSKTSSMYSGGCKAATI